jgi:hypothetical protein
MVGRGRRSLSGDTSARLRALVLGGVTVVVASLAALATVPTVDAAAQSRHSERVAATTTAPVIGAVGDMACDPSDPHFNGGQGTPTGCAENAVSSLMLADTRLVAVLGLGDFQYACGDPADYAVSYNPTWGRLDPIMDPVAGNHEYQTGKDAFGKVCPSDNTTAQSYFSHFGAAAHPATGGHFSFDLGTWHLIALNGNCTKTGVGGCTASSAQTEWLQQDLASTRQPCIAAFWHQPLFTGTREDGSAYRPWWKLLYAAHADVVLNAHIHDFQRYPALDPSGAADPTGGITEYVVGTGGEGFTDFVSTIRPKPVVHLQRFGYLRIRLNASGWRAKFIDSTGTVADTSTGTCHS